MTSEQPTSEEEASGAIALIQSGGDLAGALVGAAVGLIGGPAGAFGGAAVGVAASRTLRWVGFEFHRRVLAPREQQRIGATLAEVAVVTRDRVAAGDELRTDGYFERDERGRSDADELLEAVLQTAARTYQERKLPYIARLWPNVAVSPEISPSFGQLLAQLAEDLTYDALVALALVHNKADPIPKAFADVALAGGGVAPRDPEVVAELDRLATLGLVAARDINAADSRDAVMPIYRFFGSGFRDIGISQAVLTDVGEVLWRVLNLVELPLDEQVGLLRRFSQGRSDGPPNWGQAPTGPTSLTADRPDSAQRTE